MYDSLLAKDPSALNVAERIRETLTVRMEQRRAQAQSPKSPEVQKPVSTPPGQSCESGDLAGGPDAEEREAKGTPVLNQSDAEEPKDPRALKRPSSALQHGRGVGRGGGRGKTAEVAKEEATPQQPTAKETMVKEKTNKRKPGNSAAKLRKRLWSEASQLR